MIGTCAICAESDAALCRCSTCPRMICEWCGIGDDLQCKRCMDDGRKPPLTPVETLIARTLLLGARIGIASVRPVRGGVG